MKRSSDVSFNGLLFRRACYAGRSGDWESYKEEFQNDGKLSVRARIKVRECYEEVPVCVSCFWEVLDFVDCLAHVTNPSTKKKHQRRLPCGWLSATKGNSALREIKSPHRTERDARDEDSDRPRAC